MSINSEQACTDRLSALLVHFPVQAQLFHAGALCGITKFSAEGGSGQMHLVRSGYVRAIHPGRPVLIIEEPSLLLYPRAISRRFVTDSHNGAELACAQLHFDGGVQHPVAAALPDVICLALKDLEGAAAVLDLLFAEAFGNNCGREKLIERLFEVVLIQVLRHLMEKQEIGGGMLAGLSHAKLRHALISIHQSPQLDWTLDRLASSGGMSRSVFANTFREIVGCTPGAYLQSWRIMLAQKALLQGLSMKKIAGEVGYGSEASLSRAFKSQTGITAREWYRQRSVQTL